MFIKIRYCSISLCILLLNLYVQCQGQQKILIAFPESEEVVSTQKNAQKKTPVYLRGLCRDGEIFYPGDQFNDWVCDCKPGYIYYPRLLMCYPVYRQGPCKPGEYLIKPKTRGTPVCQRNPCEQDKLVPFQGGCYEFDTPGPCKWGHLSNVVGVNETTFEIICTKDEEFSIGGR